MAGKKKASRFESLFEAVRDGTAEDVRAIITEAGGVPDEREEDGDPTPLMYAAALGRLEMVRVMVEGGADVNALASFEMDLPPAPFLDPLVESGQLRAGAMSALAYAAAYRREDVVEFLRPHTDAELREDARGRRRPRRLSGGAG
jgi:ankyrin repeat protein